MKRTKKGTMRLQAHRTIHPVYLSSLRSLCPLCLCGSPVVPRSPHFVLRSLHPPSFLRGSNRPLLLLPEHQLGDQGHGEGAVGEEAVVEGAEVEGAALAG